MRHMDEKRKKISDSLTHFNAFESAQIGLLFHHDDDDGDDDSN